MENKATSPQSPLFFARQYAGVGYSVTSLRLDGTKKPVGEWKVFQQAAPSETELSSMFVQPRGIALIHGAVSGNSLVLDFDKPGAYTEFVAFCADHGRRDLVESLVCVSTPSDGTHLYLRCTEPVAGNEKLAHWWEPVPTETAEAMTETERKQQRLTFDSVQLMGGSEVGGWFRPAVKIETRGEGGYTVAPGSPASVHELRKPYRVVGGSFKAVPVVSAEDLKFLLTMARALNEYAEPAPEPKPSVQKPLSLTAGNTPGSEGKRPGDDYNERGTDADTLALLHSIGWQNAGERTGPHGPIYDLTRPGKTPKQGTSATLGAVAPGVFYPFTANAHPFESERGYDRFGVYCLVMARGDASEAARQLAREGYGDQRHFIPSGRAPGASRVDRPSGTSAIEATAEPVFTDAPRPLTANLLPVPPMPALPSTLQPWIDDIAERGCFPKEYIAAPVLVSLSSLVGRGVGIRPKRRDDWTVTPNLWGVVIGPPGVQKSPAVTEALKPLGLLEARTREQFDREKETFDAEQAVTKALADAAKDSLKAAAKKTHANRDDLRVLALEAQQKHEAEPPTWRRFKINDATVEKLGELLSENPNGLLQYRDELAGFLKTLDKQGHENARSFYLEAWNGNSPYVYDRIERGTVVIENTCLSLFGTIQPGPLSRYLRRSASGDDADGFMPRFQVMVYPDVSPEFVNVDRWALPQAKTDAYAVFERLANLDPAEVGGDLDGDNRVYLNFAPDAQDAFDLWRVQLETRLRGGMETPLIQTHLAKYRSLLPSLALIFHLACDGCGAVPLAAFTMAREWCEFLEAHARRVYQSALEGDTEAAAALGERLKKRITNPFKPWEIARNGWSGLSTPEEVDRAIALLEDRGWVKTVETGTTEKGGRPSTLVYINPQLMLSLDD